MLTKNDWVAVWKLQVPHKVKFFIWRCLQNALATKDQLAKRGCQNDETCPICGEFKESIEHFNAQRLYGSGLDPL